jgi:ketosteroid isomerase-like protein
VLTLQEISDRLEIQDLLARYSEAIDRHDLDALDTLFTEDAVVDYSEFGGPRGNLATVKGFLAEVLPLHAGHYHLVGSTVAEIDGDTAAVRSICHNPMLLKAGEPDGSQQLYLCGLWYRDKMVRTPAGWRIRERYEEKCFLWFPDGSTR